MKNERFVSFRLLNRKISPLDKSMMSKKVDDLEL